MILLLAGIWWGTLQACPLVLGAENNPSVNQAPILFQIPGNLEPFPLGFSSGTPPDRRASREVTSTPESSLPPPKPVDSHWLAPLAPAEAALLADAEDGRLDHHPLLRAALIASGTLQQDQLHQYETKFQEWVSQLGKEKIAAQEPLQRAESIFQFMHQKILTGGYDQRASDLAQTLQTGRYNCLSASVLYECLLEAFGMKAFGVEMPGHARTRVRIGDRLVDVETTCAQWFDLLRRSPIANRQKSQALSAASPWYALSETPCPEEGAPQAGQPALGIQEASRLPTAGEGNPLDHLGLVALIYYNRGVDLLADGQFQAALAANAKALRLAPGHPTAWGNFLATMNNWAVSLGRAGQYAEAAELLRQGLDLAPSYKPFPANFVYVHYQWMRQLCREGRFAEAWQMLTQGASTVPPSYAAAFRAMELELAKNWTARLLAQGQQSEAIGIWQEVRHRLGPGADVLQAEKAAFQGQAQEAPLPVARQMQDSQTAPVSAPIPLDGP